MNFSFKRTAGMEDAKAFLTQSLATGKFPHALLVHGPEGVGQNALLLDIADILLCENAETKPCGKCAGCLGRKRNNLDNLHFLMPLEKKDKAGEGEMEGAQVDELAQRAADFQDDPYGFSRSEKGRIHILQIREMQARLSYAEASKKVRIILILWAESMPHEAANALLKTLEEPPPSTYFLLSSEDRGALLPTILSRCMQLPVFPLEAKEFRAAMAAKKEWWDGAPPERLIPFAEGSLGVLLKLHRNGGDTLLEEAGRFLNAALRRDKKGELHQDWRAFSDYLDESEAFEEMEACAKLLHFILRTVRLFHRLQALEGTVGDANASEGGAAGHGDGASGGAGGHTDAAAKKNRTAVALRAQGWDPALADFMTPLEAAPDLSAFAAFVEEILAAVQGYSKPKIAALGAYLEFESKHLRKETHA